MNIYAVYTNPIEKNNNFILVKEGFSLVAALLNVFWAAYHRIWLPIIVTIVLNAVIFTINIQELIFINKIVVMLIFGFLASDIREYWLKGQNYELTDIVIARSLIEAELKYLKRTLYV